MTEGNPPERERENAVEGGARPAVRRERDRTFDLLSDWHRRRTAALLIARDESLSVEDVVDHLLVDSDRERGRLVTSLIHVHLPKLAAADVIEYDRETGRVAPGSGLDAFAPFLDIELRRVA